MSNSTSEHEEPRSFTDVAPYYDELMRQVPYRMWVGYYLLLLSHQDVRPTSILDVCCGTGTMCEFLTEEGYEMAGVDLSAEMIRVAKKKAGRNRHVIQYEVGDAAEFEMGRQFDAALSFFDSLNNILEEERLQGAFHQIAKHIKPGGSFIFDVNTAFAFETDLFDQDNLNKASSLRYQWRGDWNPETQIITVTMNFWKNGQEFQEIHRQRAYPDAMIRAMLERAGFTQIRAFHSYTLNPPRHQSDRIHYCTIKA
ncbi:MAG: class I SAM-dependent methyltransferase [Fimbriimonadaceae bacterium]|nr:class I SAM-dependent methyltransferase [Fimbriimonadaceae bacterium]